MDQHTLAVGTTVSQQYGSWGLTGHVTKASLGTSFFLLISPPGAGKTSLLQSHAGALIINLDLSRTPVNDQMTHPPLAQVWPSINDNGQPIDVDGRTFVLNYDLVRGLNNRLLEAAKNNQPRPQTIIYDSSTTLLSMMVADAQANLLKTNFTKDDLPWAQIYDDFVATCVALRMHGYGVGVTAHLGERYVPVGENLNKQEIMLSGMPDKLYSRLSPRLEYILAIEKVRETKYEPILVPNPAKPGQLLPSGRTKETNIDTVALVNYSTVLSKLVKSRSALPNRIALPGQDAWPLVEAEFAKGLALKGA